MVSRKLFESDKKKILELYRLPGETTSTLAERYGVSNSTISRILKSNLDEAEYESLIQQKRGRSQADSVEVPAPEVSPQNIELQEPVASNESDADAQLEIQLPATSTAKPAAPIRRARRRSSAATELLEQPEANSPINSLPLSDIPSSDVPQIVELVQETTTDTADPVYAETAALEQMLGEDFLDQEEDLTGLEEDEDEEDDDLEEDDLDDDLEGEDGETGVFLVGSKLQGKTLVQVLPFAEASLPRTCYLVVDRSAELIARPLKEFGDLGQIPEAEILEKTLPIFDNHRVAKRYSNPRTQRVIKLPDGRVLHKASSHLQAKGITRLLIDGQVYALQ
ncbi:helix-turn-helix domain containing protein [Kovacikia minuta CCNUW1]|uniref:helix-turn-helix domain containing protein n=1 Tax=Kovacikia minuta TaxID=2931930 RepID=UPI001CCE0E70|nr:helix-turn-helix domain containing protein [Kovacikia minuta]UBF27305.1 helix-turn-helix domain containing protein [Kovacikia minuta CCNUW1]